MPRVVIDWQDGRYYWRRAAQRDTGRRDVVDVAEKTIRLWEVISEADAEVQNQLKQISNDSWDWYDK